VDVTPGDQIPKYTILGLSGFTGYILPPTPPGAHLHYDHVDCDTFHSLPWAPTEGGSFAEGVTITSQDAADPVCTALQGGCENPQTTANPQPPTGNRQMPGPPNTGGSGGGTPAGPHKGFHVGDSFLGGTWARSDPNDGVWHSQGDRPANAAYWYPNGLGVEADCASAAAVYTVHFADGHTETWNTWFHVTDRKWFPSAAAQEATANEFYGLSAC
jgi:hypothetical protein